MKRLFLCSVLLAMVGIAIPMFSFATPNTQIVNDSFSGNADLEKLDQFYATLEEKQFIDLQVNLLNIAKVVSEDQKVEEIRSYFQKLSDFSWQTYGMSINKIGWSKREELVENPKIIEAANQLFPLFQGLNPIVTGCSYSAVTGYDPEMTKRANYSFQGHVALYFRVDGNADCYRKNCSVSTWCI